VTGGRAGQSHGRSHPGMEYACIWCESRAVIIGKRSKINCADCNFGDLLYLNDLKLRGGAVVTKGALITSDGKAIGIEELSTPINFRSQS